MYGTVSVVVPVYNVEKYIKECLDSIVNQTYKNLQIILVDDGSTDRSGVICDEYAQKDNRITVVHQKNGGAGAAKNTGLDLAVGEYISLVDSDDVLELDIYEKMLSLMLKKKVDVVQCGFINYFDNGKVEKSLENRKLTVYKFLKEYPTEWIYAVFWNKLFKSDLLGDIRFPKGRKIDDEFFTYKVISNAKYILNINEALYNYRIRKSSVMNDNKQDRLISDRVDCFVERYEFIKENNPKLSRHFYRHLSDILLYYKTQASSEEVLCKIEQYIARYPYYEPNFFCKIKNRLMAKATDKVTYNEMKYFE